MKTTSHEKSRKEYFEKMLKAKNRSLNYYQRMHDEESCLDVSRDISYIEDAIKALDGDDEFGTICICAVRYALGRETYMPTLVQKFIKRHINELTREDLDAIRYDIEHAGLLFGGYGSETIDKPQWMAFLAYLKDELRLRQVAR